MNSKKKKVIALLIILLLAVSVGGYYLWHQHQKTPTPEPNLDSNATDWNGDQKLDAEKMNPANIELPCFEKMVLVANQTEQKVNFHNPKNNPCYLQISLLVGDETIWKSEMLEPDKGFYSIDLTRTLDIGHYTGYIFYQCYSLDKLEELNGADVAIDLIVQ